MKRIAVVLTGASIALLALLGSFQPIGLGNGAVDQGAPIALAAADTLAVDITEDGFSPSSVTVAVGGTISWTNRDSDAHSVIGEPGSGLASPAFERWGMYSRTFRVPGTIAYHDGLNPELTGTISVVDGDVAPPAAEQPAPVVDDPARVAPPTDAQTSAPSVAGTVNIDAGTDWFGNANYQHGVYETTIQAGDTVQWNIVEAVHTVYECGENFSGANSCTNAAWSSDILSAPATFSQQFNTAGTYYYLCTLHPVTMRGSITVQAAAPPVASDPVPPAASDSGPSASSPDGSNSPPAPADPDAVPNAGFGSPSDPSGFDYLPLSVLMMAAAGLTFLGSSVMLIRQRVSGSQAAAVDSWAALMVEPTPAHQEQAAAQPSAAVSRARLTTPPTLQPWRSQDQPTDHETDELEALRKRLASINARFERIVRKVGRQ